MRGRFLHQDEQGGAPSLRSRHQALRREVPAPGGHHVPIDGRVLPGDIRTRHRGEVRQGAAQVSRYAAFGSAALAFSTIAWNAAGSMMAISDITLRSTRMPALASPSMNFE